MTVAVQKPLTVEAFGAIYLRLARQLRAVDVGLDVIRDYFDALADCDADAVAEAGRAFGRELEREWMPTAPAWRAAAIAEHTKAWRAAQPSARTEPWRVECSECDDTGWVLGLTCDGGGAQWPEEVENSHVKAQARETRVPRPPVCGRNTAHLPHSYTAPCPCRATNHTYQRRRLTREAGD